MGQNNNSKINLTEESAVLLKLFNRVTMTLGVCGLLSLLISMIMHFSNLTLVLMICEEIVLLFCLFIANILKHPRGAAVIMCIATNNVFLPILFVLSGGIQSGAFIWYVVGLLLPWIFLTNILCFVISTINIAGAVFAIVISLVKPEYLLYKHDLLGSYVSVISAIFFLCVILGVIITYQKKMHEVQRKEILESMEKAQNATKAKDEFFRNLTHDIRTPMNAVVGFTEIARRNVDDKNKLLDCLGKILLSGKHLVAFIDGVLDLSTLESGSENFKNETVNLRNLIEKLSTILQYKIEEKQITLHVDLSNIQNEVIITDSMRLNQLLMNILENATKYSKSEGNIYFSVVESGTREPEKRRYVFKIKDDGIGMTPEQITHIFEPLNHESRLSRKNHGTGLGMSISKKIVDLMGGQISIHSEYDKGTEITITCVFPVSNLYEVSEKESVEKLSFEGKRVLIVDDNELNSELAGEVLQMYDFDVDYAQTGSVAVEKIQVSPEYFYDLILMDITMPGINGYDATKIIRSYNRQDLKLIPIVALSANAFVDDKRKAMEAGMNGYITKPFDAEELIRVLQLLLQDDERD